MLGNGVAERAQILKGWGRGLSAVVMVAGLLALAIWVLGGASLVVRSPDNPLMAPNSALGLTVTAASYLVLTAGPPRRWLGRILALVPLFLGVGTLLEYVLGVTWKLDNWLLLSGAWDLTTFPGRPSLLVAVSLCLLALALLLFDVATWRGRRPAEGLAILGAVLSYFALLDFLYGGERFLEKMVAPATPIGFAAALAILSLFLAILFGHAAMGVLRPLIGEELGAKTARWLLPAVLLLPSVIGYVIGSSFRWETPGMRVTIALFSVSASVLAGAVVMAGVIQLNASDRDRQRASRQLKGVIEQVPGGVVLADENGRLAFNAHALSYAGNWPAQTDRFGNQVRLRLCSPTGELVSWDRFPLYQAWERREATVGEEWTLCDPEGHHVPILVSAAPLPDGGAVATFQDITLQKELTRMREEWMAIIAHDLRQPIGVIALASSSLAQLHGAELSEAAAALVEQIRCSVNRLERMVSDLLDYSKIEARQLSLRRQSVAVSSFLRGVSERLSPVLGKHPLVLSLPEPDLILSVDPERIEQVLTNLVQNAAQYGEPATPIHLAVRQEDQAAVMLVSNRGREIPPERLAHLFERFYRWEQRTGGGLGLGLYISKGIVEAHGGDIQVKSEPDGWTTFRLTFPLENATERAA